MGILTEEWTKIIITETAGADCCVAACDGQKVHDRIVVALCENKEVELSFTDIPEEDEIILKRVIDRAKTYFENANSCRKALSDVLGGEDA
jgi:hypothetical protein